MINKIMFFLLVPICICYRSYADENKIDTLQMQAVMLVHADATNFSIGAGLNSLKDIMALYQVTPLKVSGIKDCSIFKITSNTPCCNCEFIIAYNYDDKNFYRLSGFRVNEFTAFYGFVLLSGNVPNLKSKSQKKTLVEILSKVSIDGYDISKAYKHYYGNFKASIDDTNSCYRKSIIRAY